MLKNRIKAMPMLSFDSAVLTGVYIAMTPAAGISHSLTMFKIQNESDVDILVSYDNGATDHDIVPAYSTNIYPTQWLAQPTNSIATLAKGTQVWINGNIGNGMIYLVGYYQESI